MKFAFAALLLAFSSESFAATYNSCLFGENSSQMLTEISDIKVISQKKIMKRNSRLFDAKERELILISVGSMVDESSWDQLLTVEADFLTTYDYSLIKMKDKNSGKVYAYVKGYPGDNEAGDIFDLATKEKVASIGDGDVVDCKVKFTAFNKLPIQIPPQTAEGDSKVYNCHFGSDLLAVARSKKFQISRIEEQGVPYYLGEKATLREKANNARYSLEIKTWNSGRPDSTSEATIKLSTGPSLVLATYRDGLAQTCVESEE